MMLVMPSIGVGKKLKNYLLDFIDGGKYFVLFMLELELGLVDPSLSLLQNLGVQTLKSI